MDNLRRELQNYSSLRNDLDNLTGELQNYSSLRSDLDNLRRELQNYSSLRGDVDNLRRELQNYSSLRGDVDNLRQELQNYSSLRGDMDNLRRETQNYSSLREETSNYVGMLQTTIINNSDALKAEINRIETEIGLSLINSQMQTRLLLAKREFENSSIHPGTTRKKPVKHKRFEEYLEAFKNLHPHLFETWAKINFGVNIQEYQERPQFSCGVDSRLDAKIFAGFIAPYLQGRVLDVGCGPLAVTNYLNGYPTGFISGIDPLEPFEPHPFEFVRGFVEFLPWEDGAFNVVVAATSLDHVLDLDLAISEIKRVLKPGGVFLVWEWFGDHAKPYDPVSKSPELVDRYHLFNFDQVWFEEYMTKHFTIEEKFQLFGEYSHYHYYCLKK
jgi:ubiquinone/menaquinone biosynthesis C-methylase UbiE